MNLLSFRFLMFYFDCIRLGYIVRFEKASVFVDRTVTDVSLHPTLTHPPPKLRSNNKRRTKIRSRENGVFVHIRLIFLLGFFDDQVLYLLSSSDDKDEHDRFLDELLDGAAVFNALLLLSQQ